MANVGAYPPPPGVEPNFVNPVSQRETMFSVHIIGLTLTTLSVVMRFYTRQFITHGLDCDDCKGFTMHHRCQC